MKDAGVQAVGLSVDTPEFSLQFENKILEKVPGGKVPDEEEFPLPLLSDTEKKVIERFDLVDQNSPVGVIAAPATILTDAQGVIKWIFKGRNYKERPSVEDILSALLD